MVSTRDVHSLSVTNFSIDLFTCHTATLQGSGRKYVWICRESILELLSCDEDNIHYTNSFMGFVLRSYYDILPIVA